MQTFKGHYNGVVGQPGMLRASGRISFLIRKESLSKENKGTRKIRKESLIKKNESIIKLMNKCIANIQTHLFSL